jgi:HAD superfamily hydrolase (TIGR01509 family)
MLKAIFFDHDGTLVNSEVEHCRCWRLVMQQHGINLSIADYMALYCGVPGLENAQMLIDAYGLAIPAIELSEEKEVATQAYLDKQPYPLMPQVRETLEYFQKTHLRLAVVSGATEQRILTSLDGHDIGGYFDFLCGANEVARNKPDPSLYLLGVEKSGFQVDECLAIEDTKVGVKSAIEAGLACCAIRNDYALDEDLSTATVVVNNMGEARRWVETNYL